MNKKKAKQKGLNPKLQEPVAKGFDFGSSERSLLVSSFDFLKALGSAGVIACAYGSQKSSTLGITLPVVSIVGDDEGSLKSAFKEFQRWGGGEDGDIVELHFIFLQNGGYLLGIGPEPERMALRMRGYDRVLVPLQCGGTWVKKFDSRHRMLEQLADYKKRLISPLILNAAFHPKVGDPTALSPHLIRDITGLEPILKFEAVFSMEQDVQERSPEWAILEIYRSGKTETGSQNKDDKSLHYPDAVPGNDPKSFLSHRQEMLCRHFPVTLARFRRSSAYSGFHSQLYALGVRPWQIEQAVCNLILSQTICACDHYVNIAEKDLAAQVISALQSRFEQANNQDGLGNISPPAVERQVVLDSIALLNHFSIHSKSNSLQALVARLNKEGLLGD